MTRIARLMPNNVPRYIRCYDDGGEGDRYTVVFTKAGSIDTALKGGSYYLALTSDGSFYRGTSDIPIDKPSYSHLGKRIKFHELPEACQKVVRSEYMKVWRLAR